MLIAAMVLNHLVNVSRILNFHNRTRMADKTIQKIITFKWKTNRWFTNQVVGYELTAQKWLAFGKFCDKHVSYLYCHACHSSYTYLLILLKEKVFTSHLVASYILYCMHFKYVLFTSYSWNFYTFSIFLAINWVYCYILAAFRNDFDGISPPIFEIWYSSTALAVVRQRAWRE